MEHTRLSDLSILSIKSHLLERFSVDSTIAIDEFASLRSHRMII